MPARDIAKFIAFLLMVGSVYAVLLYEHPGIRWAAVIYTIIVAGASADRRAVLHARGDDPGLLPSMTLLFPVGGMVIASGLPALLHDFGYLPTWRFDWHVLLNGFLSGAFLALLQWIPFLAYLAIDHVFDRWRPQPAP